MKDRCRTRMFANFFNSHYDSYCPEYSHTLVNSIGSYINSKLGHERKTADFITELRQKLYFIHEYNCQVAKITHKYPRSRKFDLLLIKYVELEFDILYKSNGRPSVQLQLTTELRVLRLLQIMLYPAVLNNEPLVSRNTDEVLKKAVLQLLGEVRSRYLVKNKLVCNLISKLLQKIDGKSKDLDFPSSSRNISRNLATSDYGTDDSDSDIGNNRLLKKLQPNNHIYAERISPDCIEVPLLNNGVAAIPTIEFLDDDNYLVYLEKQIPRKRKIKDHCKRVCKKKKFGHELIADTASNKNESSAAAVTSTANYGTRNCSSKDITKPVLVKNDDTACVVVCSDSEDESCDKTSNVCKPATDKKKIDTVKDSNKGTKLNVVTFEILDDDDSDQTNYMVYLQKEVKTNQKRKKQIHLNEIIICSDSEDDPVEKSLVVESGAETQEAVPLIAAQNAVTKNNFNNDLIIDVPTHNQLKVEVQEVGKVMEDIKNSTAAFPQDGITSGEFKIEMEEIDLKNLSTSFPQNDTIAYEHPQDCQFKTELQGLDKTTKDVEKSGANLLPRDVCYDHLREPEFKNEIQDVDKRTHNTNLVITNEAALSNNNCQLQHTEAATIKNSYVNKNPNVGVDGEHTDYAANICNDENTNVLVLNNEIEPVACETSVADFFVAPSVVEEAQLNKNKEVALSLSTVTQNQKVQCSKSSDKELQGKNLIDVSATHEKIDDLESVDNVQVCRINDTLLEEFLLEDSFSLEGRKEFEELEFFLFSDTTDKPGSYLSTFSFDDSETVLQPDTFDADVKSLEAFLDDSKLISSIDCQLNSSNGNSDNLFEISEIDIQKNNTPYASNSCKLSSSASADEHWKERLKSLPCRTQRDFKTLAKHSKKTKKR